MIDAASTKTQKNQKNGFDADTALALIMDAQLSRKQYETIRAATKNIGYDMFPSYKIFENQNRSATQKILTLQRVRHQIIYKNY